MTFVPKPQLRRVARLTMSALVAVCLAASVAGCGDDSKKSAKDSEGPQSTAVRSALSPPPTLPRAVSPASAAGGTCKKLSFEQINQELGLEFSVAAPHTATVGETKLESCTVRAADNPLPDLTLTFVAGKLDTKAFDEQFEPDGAQQVSGLGKDAYSIVSDAAVNSGPASEIGWYTDTGSYTLVVTQPRDGQKKTAQALVGKLVALGKKLT